MICALQSDHFIIKEITTKKKVGIALDDKIRYTFSPPEKTLPIYLDSVGYNPQELDFDRPEGYPYYHWLQTIEGQGVIEFNDRKLVLDRQKAVLLAPYTPHRYHPNYEQTSDWSTVYLTFSGEAIDQILNALDMSHSAVYHEEDQIDLFYQSFQTFFNTIESSKEASPLIDYELSGKLYQFLMTVKKYGTIDEQFSANQSYEKIRPIVEWLEQVYSENIGLMEISEQAHMSSQHLNKLFHDTFGLSPYAFLVQLRIREAKRLLLTDVNLTLREIAEQVGFNAVSHFVTTFKNKEGMTPKKYRDLHASK
ncbi:AraC-type DNA-binding protein [Pelagirhabdus alkalitolerans]|uniref:AraC-type DNA-binding protein n=1 Tax=Pelagirhabdus alkalitolerans TaxID=1612202 RepID=A0A1G6L1M2_9BACI|nr:AraC family transcriptional regulator [Pelagirhabdus alkalitolerans]SDC37230.1 AraC-type DNA-binding protein [Pelagirhabdus alkalitolerans]